MLSCIGSILMLHRIAPYESGKLKANENMKISPDELRLIIKQFRNKNKEFVSMDELCSILREGKRPRRQCIAVTLDDGYKDNLSYGLDIFHELKVPFCIYVTNSFPDRKTSLWWYALEQLVIENNELRISGQLVGNRSAAEKHLNFMRLRSALLLEKFREPILFLQQCGTLNFDLESVQREMTLTWDEIRSISRESIATIGAHTLNHFPISRLPENEARLEIEWSKQEIEKQIQKSVRHFAFPFGTPKEAGIRDYKIAAEAQFDSVVTTVHGHVHLKDNPHTLNRIFLYPPSLNGISLNRIMYWNIRNALSLVNRIIH